MMKDENLALRLVINSYLMDEGLGDKKVKSSKKFFK